MARSIKNKEPATRLIEHYHREADRLRRKGEEKDWLRTEEFCYALVELYQLLTGEVPMFPDVRVAEPKLPAVEFGTSSELYEVHGVNVSSGEEYVRRLKQSGDLGEKTLPERTNLLRPKRHRD
jgi:hypothetical protein